MDLQREQLRERVAELEADLKRLEAISHELVSAGDARIAELDAQVAQVVGELVKMDDVLVAVHAESKLHVARIAALEAECADYERTFELQRKRMAEATEVWRAAHPGKELVWPDLGDLLAWLLEERGRPAC